MLTQLWNSSNFPKPDLGTGLLFSIPSPPSGSFSVVNVSPCGERIAAADRRGNVFLFDLKENQGILLHRAGRGVTNILFANSSDVIIVLNDSTLRLVNRYLVFHHLAYPISNN
jgi:WD40 repeat protein